MNSNDNQRDLAGELGRGLRDRVSSLHDAPFDLEDVKGRAGEIRRRRRITTVLVAAAVAAVVVPTAFLVAPGLNTSGEIPPAGPSPTIVSPSEGRDETEPPQPGERQELDVSDLEAGEAPRMGYLEGGVIRLPDGSEIEPRTSRRPDGFAAAPGSGGYAVTTRDDEGNRRVDIVDGQGVVQATYPTPGGLAVTNGGTVVWVTPGGAPSLLLPDGGDLLALGTVPTRSPDLVAVGGESCETVPAGRGECLAYVNDGGENGGAYVSRDDGSVAEASSRIIRLADVSPEGHLVGIVEVKDDMSTCSVLEEPNGNVRWKTCENRFVAFSPTGEHLLAVGSVGSGIGEGELAMYDAESGTRVTHWIGTRPESGFIGSMVWEDDEHVLATVHQGGQWSVVRFGLDGSMERALGPVAGEDVDPAFLLETRP